MTEYFKWSEVQDQHRWPDKLLGDALTADEAAKLLNHLQSKLDHALEATESRDVEINRLNTLCSGLHQTAAGWEAKLTEQQSRLGASQDRVKELEAFVVAEGECHISHEEVEQLRSRLDALQSEYSEAIDLLRKSDDANDGASAPARRCHYGNLPHIHERENQPSRVASSSAVERLCPHGGNLLTCAECDNTEQGYLEPQSEPD